MKNNVAAGERLLNRCRIAQIADHPATPSSGVKICNIAQIARRPHQKPQLSSLLRQNARNVTTQKSGGSGNESFQKVLSSQFPVPSQNPEKPDHIRTGFS